MAVPEGLFYYLIVLSYEKQYRSKESRAGYGGGQRYRGSAKIQFNIYVDFKHGAGVMVLTRKDDQSSFQTSAQTIRVPDCAAFVSRQAQ